MSNANRPLLWLALGCSCAIGLLACSGDSLWIDEAWVALIASENDLVGWWRRMQETGGSTLQMPLYTLYLWAWEKIAGHGEWALRAANIPLFVLGQWALFRGLRKDFRLAIWAMVIAAASPFVWSYLAEARPYTMQYAAACLVVAGLMQLRNGATFSRSDLALFCLGLVLVGGASALGFPWAGMAAVMAIFLLSRRRDSIQWDANKIILVAATGGVFALILAYDLWVARHGARASGVGATNSQNLLFVAYELLGFGGLGPPRLEIRATPSLFILFPYFLPLGTLLTALSISLARLRKVEGKMWMTFLIYSAVPLMIVVALAIFAPFRLLARHVTPIAPVIFVLLAYAASSPSRWGMNRMFLPLWLLSAILLRFYPAHHRDDYRTAATIAKEAIARGELVWWAADRGGAEYYGLRLNNSDQLHEQVALLSANRSDLQGMPPPGLVVLSKGDLFDSAGDLQRFLMANQYKQVRTLPAFSIWQAPK